MDVVRVAKQQRCEAAVQVVGQLSPQTKCNMAVQAALSKLYPSRTDPSAH